MRIKFQLNSSSLKAKSATSKWFCGEQAHIIYIFHPDSHLNTDSDNTVSDRVPAHVRLNAHSMFLRNFSKRPPARLNAHPPKFNRLVNGLLIVPHRQLTVPGNPTHASLCGSVVA